LEMDRSVLIDELLSKNTDSHQEVVTQHVKEVAPVKEIKNENINVKKTFDQNLNHKDVDKLESTKKKEDIESEKKYSQNDSTISLLASIADPEGPDPGLYLGSYIILS